MKILVFSDSHRSVAGMLSAVADEAPDQIIHLGDLEEDAEAVSYAYPRIPLCMVPGNCDGWTTHALKKQITLDGVRILLSHGHLWGVKGSYDAAVADARACQADILLFGHTHRPLCRQLEDGLWMLNPGSARTTYGVIELDRGHLQCTLRQMP